MYQARLSSWEHQVRFYPLLSFFLIPSHSTLPISRRGRWWKNHIAQKRWLQGYGCLHHVRPRLLFYLLAPSSISTGVIQQLVSFIPSVSGQQRLYKPSRLNTLVIGMVSVTIQTDIHYDPSLSLVHTQELHHGESTFLLSCTASP